MKNKLLRKEYPKVRTSVKAGNTYYVVDLRRKHYTGPKFKWFNDRQKSLEYAADIGEKVAKSGLDSISLTLSSRRAACAALRVVGI